MKRLINFSLPLFFSVFFSINLIADEINKLTIVNGSYGGGWELTSKVTGNTLVSLGLVKSFRIETLEGAAGWRALDMFIANDKFKNDILVQSEPLISGFLKKMYRKGFRDLRPIALVAAEYSCLIVAYNSPYNDLSEVLSAIKSDPSKIPISLGGRAGAGDHITANIIFKAANINNPADLRYTFSDGGDNATIDLLSNTEQIIGISGYNSIITHAVAAKKIRVIAITSKHTIDGHRSFKEQGVDIEYANWRGFFARKNISNEKFNAYSKALNTLSHSPKWHRVLKENDWSPFYKTGPELNEFLIQHEKKLKMTMQELNIIK
jgi:putative tricarboxylic transport membrane protein